MVGAHEVKLSPKEYDILQQFVIHAGKVLTHRYLLLEVWNSETSGNVQSLRVFVRQLRQKVGSGSRAAPAYPDPSGCRLSFLGRRLYAS
jgi:DNA-binding response OmpR family regulator